MSSSWREWRNWQTRTVQVRVPERAWGFKSPLAHHLKTGSDQHFCCQSLLSFTARATREASMARVADIGFVEECRATGLLLRNVRPNWGY